VLLQFCVGNERRLLMFSAISTIRIPVKDVSASLQWYVKEGLI